MISKRVIFGSIAFSLCISIVGIITQNPKEFENSRFGIFIKILSSLAFILVAMGLILTAQAFEESQKLTLVEQTYKLIDRAFLDPINKMRELYPKCPNFVKSLWPQEGLFDNVRDTTSEDDHSAILDLSILMLQSYEDHFTISGFDKTGEVVWASNFLHWAGSDKFKQMFDDLYPNFKDTTNEYAKLLFEYANKNGKIKNAEELVKRSKEFCNDKRFLKIFEEVHGHTDIEGANK